MYSPKKIPILRFLFFPFALLYGIAIYVRNFLFDKNIIASKRFQTPTICVGNLSVGGTGKTPMTEMLLAQLSTIYKTATISRGYKRKTKGFLLADSYTTVDCIGDEPMQFHENFPNILVSVGEDRCYAMAELEQLLNKPELIILDDAMQYRKLKADCNILLSDYNRLYVDDFFMPVGSLRDQRSSSHRADIIVITKCPTNMGLAEMQSLTKKINPRPYQQLFFASIVYGTLYHLITKEQYTIDQKDRIVAIAGIAKPDPYFEYLESKSKYVKKITLPDHHDFSEEDIRNIFSESKNNTENKDVCYILTEKDAVKIKSYQQVFINLSLRIYVLPIKCIILYNESDNFIKKVTSVIRQHSIINE